MHFRRRILIFVSFTGPKQWQHGNHNYFFSWDQDEKLGLFSDDGQPRKVDWLEARNQCRRRCMDAVSMETESETLMVESFMRNRKSETN